MDIHIHAKAVFSVPLTNAHITALSILSEHHYDGRCKAAGQVGGFLVDWKRMVDANESFRESATERLTIDMTFAELDTTLKILEGTGLAVQAKLLTATDRVLCRNLQRALLGAAQLANSKYAEWQATYAAQPETGPYD